MSEERVRQKLYQNICQIRNWFDEDGHATRAEIAERFTQADALCAGSFVFYHCGRAWPLHAKTKRELYALISCSKRYAVHLPQTFLRRVGELLQWSDLVYEYHRGRMDIDVFIHGRPSALFPHVKDHGQWSEYGLESSDPRGFYALFPNAFATAEFADYESQCMTMSEHCFKSGVRRMPLQLIFLTQSPREFLESNFDVDFCKNYFHRNALIIVQRDMIGEISVQKYFALARDIYEKHTEERAWAGGMDAYELLPMLRATVQERLEKYERRRFTITNAHEVREFIAQLVPPYQFLQPNFTE